MYMLTFKIKHWYKKALVSTKINLYIQSEKLVYKANNKSVALFTSPRFYFTLESIIIHLPFKVYLHNVFWSAHI